ncbi:radical SAM/SPASM domain-containing protein [Pectobacterium versatile]|uniref:radical SAM/SPASM domain-containing protein n=1 Tax=Pectobacterium versatile TaxID=2488639 RepID=UPI001304E79D|nr:radical SAM protein [Pectobacterium versatile]
MNYQTIEYVDNEIELENDYVIIIPNTIEKKFIGGKCVVVEPSSGMFMVLFNDNQIEIFEFINNKTIENIKVKYGEEDEDLNYVLMAYFDSGLNIRKHLTSKNENKSLFIYLTDKCNFTCKHCYRNNDYLHSSVLNLSDWYEIVKGFHKNGGGEVTISGGEPLLYRDIIYLIKFIKSLEIKLTILSNGTLWENVFRKDTDILKLIDEIQISLDGYDELSFSLMRGAGNFNKVLSNIQWLKANESNVSIAVTANPNIINNLSNFLNLKNFLLSLKDDFIIRLTQKILPNEAIKEFDDQLYYKRMQELSESIYPKNNISKWISVYWSKDSRDNNCGWGNLTINAIGDVYTCNRTDEAKKIGNVLTDSFSEILNKANYEREITSVDNIYPCRFCALRLLCNGGCRIDDFTSYKGILKRECTQDRKDKKYINMIEAVFEIYYGDD